MTLVVNLVRTDRSAKFIWCGWRYLWCDWHVIHTPNVTNQPKYGQIINCGLTILIASLFSLYRLRITTQLRSGAVDKMVGIFTKRIWQPYICQPNELNIKKKLGEAKEKSGGAIAHPRIATGLDATVRGLRHRIFQLLSFWLAPSLLCDVRHVTMNDKFSWELKTCPLLRNVRHRAMITPSSAYYSHSY